MKRLLNRFLYWIGIKKRGYGFNSFTIDGYTTTYLPGLNNYGIMIPEKGYTFEELWEMKSVFTGLSPKDRGISYEDFCKSMQAIHDNPAINGKWNSKIE